MTAPRSSRSSTASRSAARLAAAPAQSSSSSSLSMVIAAIRTIAAYVFCSIYTLTIGPVALVLAIVFQKPNFLYVAAIVAVESALVILGIRYEVEGAEHIDGKRPSIYTVNHVSNLEPPILFLVLARRFAPHVGILYKAVLHRLPVLGWGFDFVGFVPIERGNRDQSSKALDKAVDLMNNGHSFLVFPEGTRSRSGELLPFKKGAFIMALRAQVPVVPTAITGSRAAMTPGSFIIKPTTVLVKMGTPIPTAGMGMEGRDALIAQTRERVQDLLHDITQRGRNP